MLELVGEKKGSSCKGWETRELLIVPTNPAGMHACGKAWRRDGMTPAVPPPRRLLPQQLTELQHAAAPAATASTSHGRRRCGFIRH